MLVDLFIKDNWHTVPMKGKLERLENGKKTLPQLEENWRAKYTEKFSEQSCALAGAITGKISNIIAIDCDNEATYNIFKTLDPDYKFHFISKGKPQGGGTIIYRYDDRVPTFKLVTELLALDFYSDNGFIYLPTEDNYTKESWVGTTELPELKTPPSVVIALLSTLNKKVDTTANSKNVVRHTISNRLAPMLEGFIKSKKYDPVLFRVLTPYSFRDLPSYVIKGHLHPNDVPLGRGSEYLSKISAILGADISVNIELYTNTMMLINSLWDDPIEKSKLLATIITPMIEERACIDGVPIWQYDQHWEKMGFIATTLNGDYVESFYDDVKGLYYLINYNVPYIRSFSDKRPLVTTLRTLLGRVISDVQYDSTKQLIRTMLNPSLEFGHVEGSDKYNLFRQTPELGILTNPAPYAAQYHRPTTIINFFNSLIPDDTMRMFVLSFIKTKLVTFKYSPVILYLIGKPGSGKDTMVEIIRKIIGADYVARPKSDVFLEQYNGWMIDKFFIQLDEYGNTLTHMNDKQECLGKLKTYTGSEEIQIRAMRSDGINYKHRITFILTANSNPLPVETDDRRIAFVKTPNKLMAEQWVVAQGGISEVQNAIKEEIMDFCYYLATEIPLLSSDKYVMPPETADKEKLILNSLPALEQISFFLQNNRWTELYELSVEYNIKDFTKEWERGRLNEDKLVDLYDAMTEGHGVSRTLIRKLKEINMQRNHTTKAGDNSYYYYVADLHKYKPIEEEKCEVKAKDSGIKGL